MEIKSKVFSAMQKSFAFGLIFFILSASTINVFSQARVLGVSKNKAKTLNKKVASKTSNQIKRKKSFDDETTGEKIVTENPVTLSTAELMAEQAKRGNAKTTRQLLMERGISPEFEGPERDDLPQNPSSRPLSRFPVPTAKQKQKELISNNSILAPAAPQTVGLSFNAASLSDTGAFPPDTMGAVGPSQFFAFANGRLRTFTKAGVADGVINADPDVFFASVMTPISGSVVLNFTSDPNVRYDRLTGRWFLTIIDVPCTNASCSVTAANRILIAVSNATSNAAITAGTTWTFYQFQGDTANFTDYPSLGIDANALYIGGNMFTGAGSFAGCDVWVVPKDPLLSGTTLTSWHFAGVATASGAGPYSPRGVDNVDPSNTGTGATGYFVGVDNATFGTLMVRRVTNPSSTTASPTISANISVTVPTTNSPATVTHLGNTGGTNGNLDALDDRLYAAVMRNGRLWTAHNIRTDVSGNASTTQPRHSIRWYELQNLGATPTLFQSGTVYDTATTTATARQYWIPSITVSGQGHAAIGSTTAGTPYRLDAFTVGRLASDPLGTMQGSPGSLAGYTSSTTAYNPASDTGGTSGRRWGDYSFTSLDPLDDMTIWTIQEYCDAANSYGVRVAKLLAPPPASIADGPDAGGLYNVAAGQTSVNVTITGTSTNGSGFYDPGTNLGGNARPFNHLTASISGTNVSVNSVTYNSPTSITLNLNTVGATLSETKDSPLSLRDLTITNPDGQTVTRTGIINITTTVASSFAISGRVLNNANTRGIQNAFVRLTDSLNQTVVTRTNYLGYYRFNSVNSGQNVTINVTSKGRSFNPQIVNVNGNLTNINFNALP
jgi:hypothetical protein